MEIDANTRSLVQMASRYDGAPSIIADEIKKAMTRSVLTIEASAKKAVPVDTGNLRRSLTHEVTASGGMVVGKVGSNVPYAKVVEEGRKAGATMPPPGAVLKWMARKGIQADELFIGRDDLRDVATTKRVAGGYHGIEYLVARAIGRRGIKARPYLKPALESNRAGIQREFDSLLTRVMKRLGAS